MQSGKCKTLINKWIILNQPHNQSLLINNWYCLNQSINQYLLAPGCPSFIIATRACMRLASQQKRITSTSHTVGLLNHDDVHTLTRYESQKVMENQRWLCPHKDYNLDLAYIFGHSTTSGAIKGDLGRCHGISLLFQWEHASPESDLSKSTKGVLYLSWLGSAHHWADATNTNNSESWKVWDPSVSIVWLVAHCLLLAMSNQEGIVRNLVIRFDSDYQGYDWIIKWFSIPFNTLWF